MYYTIGELAKIFNISTQTLRYYHKLKLFSPINREDNNYRLYSSNQFQDLRTILYLKDIGISLKDIKKYKDNKDLSYLYEILKVSEQKIEEEISNLKSLNQSIKSSLSDIRVSLSDDKIDCPIIKYFDERKVYLIHKNFGHESISDEIENLIEKIYHVKEDSFNLDVRSLGTIVSHNDLLRENYSKYSGIFMVQENSSYKNLVTFPKGKYASIYHKGDYESIGTSYEKLISFIKEKGYKIKSFAIDLALIDIKLSINPKDYITEIQILLE